MMLFGLSTNLSAETFSAYSPDSLKKGDWATIEYVEYYPYSAPGIKDEIPWRQENIRRVIFRATVADKSADNITFDFALENLYDCRNDNEKSGFYYFDSNYKKDFTSDQNLLDKQLFRAVYDIKNRRVKTVDNKDISYSYSKAFVPFGVKQDGLSSNNVITIKDSLNIDDVLTPIINNLLIGWEKDGTTLPIRNARIIDASFSLPPNSEFLCYYFDPNTTTKIIPVHKKIFISHPTEYEIAKGSMVLLSPGDSITQDKESLEKAHLLRYQGRGSEQNNFRQSFARKSGSWIRFYDNVNLEELKKDYDARDLVFQSVLNEGYQNIDPYWLMVFERSEQYIKGGSILQFYMMDTDKETWHKSGLLDWKAPYFASVNPLIDYAYRAKSPYTTAYNYFLYEYAAYKKQELLSDNLSLNKHNKISSQADYLMNKQIFSGYPKYYISAFNIAILMTEKMMLKDMRDEYEDFITSCPDTLLTGRIKELYNKLLPFEAGNNIRESGLMITDSLPLKKGSDRKYILMYLTTGNGLPANELQKVLDWQKLLQTQGLASVVQLQPYGKFSSHNKMLVKPYKAIPEEQRKYLRDSLGFYSMAILMREDGTILYRQSTLEDEKTMLDIIINDMNRPKKNSSLLIFIYGCLTAFLLAFGIFYLYRLRVKTKQRREQTKRQMCELELRAIRSQMNPHFIFNALSSIQNLINRSANKEASEYLVNFSRILRKVLATSEKKLVPLSDEIEQIQLYLKLEQLRFSFSYSLSVDKNITPELIEIPGMLIQPFVENAIKHGISSRGAGNINIHISLQSQILVIDIIDDGPGISPESQNKGFGIRAISQQFEILKTVYNTEIDIKIENRKDNDPSTTGCHVKLSIPL